MNRIEVRILPDGAQIERWWNADQELVEAWARLIPQLNPFVQAPDWDYLVALFAGRATDLFTLRTSPDGQICGGLALAVYPTPTAIHAWIEDVVVAEEKRGLGYGRALIQVALERAREKGAATIKLTSRPERVAANKLYQSMGFTLAQTNLYRYDWKDAPPVPPSDGFTGEVRAS